MTVRSIVLVGGGHAHLFVLRALAGRRDIRLTLVSPEPFATYSGMVPGVLAGRYRLDEARLDLRRLCAEARATLVLDRVEAISATTRSVTLGRGESLPYDLLSLDIGSRPAGAERVRDLASVAVVKPIERAIANITAALAGGVTRRVAIVGAGAGGVELAFAIAARLRSHDACEVWICDSADRAVTGRHPRTSTVVARELARRGISLRLNCPVERVEPGALLLADGSRVATDLVVWATGAKGPELFRTSGLATDSRGFFLVGGDLRCREHPEIFGAGDCITLIGYPSLAKAGVYAVRQGPILTHNLAAAMHQQPLREFAPQSQFLSLLDTGDGRAIFSYGPLAFCGRTALWLKERIDRRFVAVYSEGV